MRGQSCEQVGRQRNEPSAAGDRVDQTGKKDKRATMSNVMGSINLVLT